MRVKYNRGALNDLNVILSYIGELNPKAAGELLSKFETAIERIAQMPEIGVRTERLDLRKIVVGNYLMVYEYTGTEIIIHYIRHGARKNPWEAD